MDSKEYCAIMINPTCNAQAIEFCSPNPDIVYAYISKNFYSLLGDSYYLILERSNQGEQVVMKVDKESFYGIKKHKLFN